MVPNAPRSHRDQEQCQQRDGENQIPDLFWFLHRRFTSRSYSRCPSVPIGCVATLR
jgi:hypothetical protein